MSNRSLRGNDGRGLSRSLFILITTLLIIGFVIFGNIVAAFLRSVLFLGVLFFALDIIGFSFGLSIVGGLLFVLSGVITLAPFFNDIYILSLAFSGIVVLFSRSIVFVLGILLRRRILALGVSNLVFTLNGLGVVILALFIVAAVLGFFGVNCFIDSSGVLVGIILLLLAEIILLDLDLIFLGELVDAFLGLTGAVVIVADALAELGQRVEGTIL